MTADRHNALRVAAYVSRALMEGYGDEPVLRNEPGAGTTAEIHLPAERIVGAQ